MKLRLCLLMSCLLQLLVVSVCWADIHGPYPGLQSLIEESDAIVILRVEGEHDFFKSGIRINSWGGVKCYIYQALKGDIQPGSRVLVPLQISFFR